MNIVAVTRILNEEDVVEPLARHHAALVDHHIVLDNGSVDRTVDILLALRAEGVKLTVLQNDSVFFSETQYNTFLYDLAVASYAADWVVFLDGDEFIGGGGAARLREVLASVPADQPSLGVQVIDYQAPTPATRDAVNVLERFVRRVRTPADNWKVFVRGGFAPGRVTVDAGNHHIFLDDVHRAPYRQTDIWLAHYPSRSPLHMGAKAATGRLKVLAAGQQELSRNRSVHYTDNFEGLKTDARAWCRRATAHFERLTLWAGLEDDPFPYLGAPLTHTRLPDYGWRGIGLMLANMEKLATAHGNLLDRHPAVRDQVDDELATVRLLAGPATLPGSFTPANNPPATVRATARRLYRRANLSDLVEMARESGKEKAVEAIPWLPPAALEIPPVAFGDADLSRPGLTLVPPGDPGATRLRHTAQSLYYLHGAVVRGDSGVVTIGNQYVSETVSPHRDSTLRPETLALPNRPTLASLQSAYHLLAGNLGSYADWLLQCLGRFRPELYEALAYRPQTVGAPQILLPTLDIFWKWESARLSLAQTLPRLPLAAEAQVLVRQLLYVPDLSGGGMNPHPALLAMFDIIRTAVLNTAQPQPPWRRLYISPDDAGDRRLANDAEIAARAEAAGFTVVATGRMAVHEQVRLFGQASHIIASHGEALANVAFCHPGAVLCELHEPHYVNWKFRRLAALRGIRYGCVLGTPIERDPLGGLWRLDLTAFETVLTDPRFVDSKAP